MSTTTKLITTEKLAWVAGIFDIKARLVLKNNPQRATQQTILYVETRNENVINELNILTGTKAELKSPVPIRDFMRKKCTEHCPEKHQHVIQEEDLTMPATARWTITGAAIVVVMFNVYPYLVDKKNYLEVIARIDSDTKLTGRGSSGIVASVRRLALLGWKLPARYELVLE